MPKLLGRVYAPSTLGSFLRAFTFGHVRQADAVASRFLHGLTTAAPGLLNAADGERVMVDIDDSVIGVYGYQKQGAGRGYTGVNGLNSFIATASTSASAPVIVAQRLRKGSAHSARGAARLIGDAVQVTKRVAVTAGASGPPVRVLLRADSAYYGHDAVQAARRGGAEVSVTVRQNASIRAAIAHIPEGAWTEIVYPNVIHDEVTGELVHGAEVAEIDYTAFASKSGTKHQRGKLKGEPVPFTGPVSGRLIVRRVKELNPKHLNQPTLFDTWRFHAFFTTIDKNEADTVIGDRQHRRHAIIEQIHADLKSSALAHLPSGKFTANAAWLVAAVMAFNLTRAAAVVADRGGKLQKATTGTIRRALVQVAARLASSARKIVLHLPERWPWETAWRRLFTRSIAPPGVA